MPIDPSIPLQIRGPQIDSPMQTMGQMMSLQQLAQRGKSQGLEMQQREAEIEKLRVFNEISRQASGKPIKERDKFICARLTERGYAQECQKYQTGQLGLKKTLSELKESEWDEAERELLFIQKSLTPYMKAKPEGRPSQFRFLCDVLEKRGIDSVKFGCNEEYDPGNHEDLASVFHSSDRAHQNLMDSKKPQMGTPKHQEWRFLRGIPSNAKLTKEQVADWNEYRRTSRDPSGSWQVVPDPSTGKPKRIWVIGTTGAELDVYEKPETERKLTMGQEIGIINTQTAAWKKATEGVRVYTQVVDQMRAGWTAVERGDANMGAQAILITFQKMLDKDSVVRQSEYARSAEGLKLISRLQGFWQKHAETGGAGVPPEELKKFVQLGEDILDKAVGNRWVAGERKRITVVLDKYKITHDTVFQPGIDWGTEQSVPATDSSDPLGLGPPPG